MKYDLEAMDFNIEAARKGDTGEAFTWGRTPEGEGYDFWFDAFHDRIPRSEWQPKLDAMIAQWERENGEGKMTVNEPKTGTLAELNVKPGDVVVCVGWKDDPDERMFVGGIYTIMESHPDGHYDGMCAVRDGGWIGADRKDSEILFRIIYRADDTPRPPKDMTDAEIGALLRAAHEGRVIELYCGEHFGWQEWDRQEPLLDCHQPARIRPEPKRETERVTIVNADNITIGRGTVITENGKPDWSTLRGEDL